MLLRTSLVVFLSVLRVTHCAFRGLNMPSQFSADLEVTSHLLNETEEYPPWRTHMKIHYDLDQGRVRAEITQGHQAGKTFIRRYDKVGRRGSMWTALGCPRPPH